MNTIERIRQMTQNELAMLGLQGVAYVKRLHTSNGEDAFGIHAADGTQLAIAGSETQAVATILQHELEPVSLH